MAQKKARSKTMSSRKASRSSVELERRDKALEGFERAVKALHKGELERAKEQLEALREAYSSESELMDRVQSYIKVCEKRLAPQRRPKTAEEMSTAGVVSLNEGDAQGAIKLLSKALELEPKNAHIHYLLAAAHARAQESADAARHLKQAIQADPTSRVHARNDADFASLRDRSEVAAVLGET